MFICAKAQIDEDIGTPVDIEETLELEDGQTDFAYDNILEYQDFLQRNPLDINRVTVEELLPLGWISERQARAIVDHRIYAGDYISLLELQAIPSISTQEAARLSQILTIRGGGESLLPTVWERIKTGENQLFLRYTRILEDQQGFVPDENGETAFEGNADKLYLRYRHRFGNNLSYGVTAEKDAGEAFFRGSNPEGFDFYSAHLWWKSPGNRVKQVALGDFVISIGEGLIIHSDFGYGKSGFVKDVKKSFRKMRPYTSITESNFLRGAAIQYQLAERLELTAFASYRRQDGNLVIQDSLDQTQNFFSSLQISGLHRTKSEIEDKGAVRYLTAGGHIEYEHKRGYVGVTAMMNRFDPGIQRGDSPYVRYDFSGEQLWNYGFNYSYFLGSLHLFGELASANPGGLAIAQGVVSSLDTKLDLALFYRRYDRDYNSYWANGLAESSRTTNEEGIYAGIEYYPAYGWHIQAYADLWSHEWLRFRIDAPSTGREQHLRVAYKKRRKYEVYMRYRSEEKYRTENVEGIAIDRIFPTRRNQLRLNVDYTIIPSLRLRNRIDFTWWRVEGVEQENGFMVFQDIIYKPLGSAFSATARYALFDTDGFDSRIYAFENDLIYNFSVPPYFGVGRRYYVNLRYKLTRQLTVEGRVSQWKYSDRDEISSGVMRIAGDRRTEVKFQVRYAFD